jgi:hypothetical protein
MQLITTILASLGVVIIALSTPAGADSATRMPPAIWLNTQVDLYRCEGKDVLRCGTETDSRCVNLGTCETYCYGDDVGVACVDIKEATENASDDSKTFQKCMRFRSGNQADVAQRYEHPATEDKHYGCSKDLTSVLICKYGFCSTDHHCKNTELCSIQSLTCEPKSTLVQNREAEIQAGGSHIEDATLTLAAKSHDSRGDESYIHYICSDDFAKIMRCSYDFCVIDHYCRKHRHCVDSPARCVK